MNQIVEVRIPCRSAAANSRWVGQGTRRRESKAFTPKIAAALLKDEKAKVKGLRSMKTGKTYDGTVLLSDTGGKYVNYRIERRDKN